jgi:prepilin-type N-terminal cleavage/methylation domain-containing protein
LNCLKSRERGFTLVELLIVTVVIVTLMGIVFRLAGVGGDSRAQAETVKRLQRVENALSGYYAAYGSYPPVPLQGRSRDITVQVNELGVQYPPEEDTAPVTLSPTLSLPTDKKISDKEKKIWRQIETACRAQPVAVLFPFYFDKDGEKGRQDTEMIRVIKATKSGGETAGFENLKQEGLEYEKPNWQDVNLFQFGLLSFLLPRYQFMLRGSKNFYDAKGKGQWEANNQLPCKMDGVRFTSWAGNSDSVKAYVCNESNARKPALVASLPSQAVCARWMPNFAGIITGGDDFYGVDTNDGDRPYLSGNIYDGVPGDRKWVHKASSSGYKGGERPDYILDGMTIADGWNHELYYYSEAPYQSYRLWSAGKNGVTFPPWLDRGYVEKTMGGKSALEAVAKWTKDDISHLTTE